MNRTLNPAHFALGKPRSKNYPNASTIIAPIGGLGGLFLGDIQNAQDFDYLRKNNIDCVLSVAASAAKLNYPRHVVSNHKFIAAKDEPRFNTFTVDTKYLQIEDTCSCAVLKLSYFPGKNISKFDPRQSTLEEAISSLLRPDLS